MKEVTDDGLSTSRTAVVLDSATHTSRASSQTLSQDILSYIFLLCLSQDQFSKPTLNEAPISVSQVCQTWRIIALSTLRLWSQLHITIQPAYAGSVSDRTLPLLAEWLKRSVTADVKIFIDHARLTDSSGKLYSESCLEMVTPADIGSLFSEIAKHGKRIKSLTVNLPENHLSDSMVTLICTKLLALDTLDLCFYFTLSGGRGALYRKRYGCLPPGLDQGFSELFAGLKELSINSGATVMFRLESGRYPACPILKRCSLLQLPSVADSVIEFLKGCPQLEEFVFSPPNDWGGGIHGPGFNPNLPTTTFNSLRALDISGGSGDFTFMVGNLLDRLHLPQLRKLVISFHDRGYKETPSWPELAHFLKKSQPPLESLTLVNDWMSTAEVLQCLRILPTLKELKIRFVQEIADALCASIHEDVPNSTAVAGLCPLLQSIDFNDEGVTQEATHIIKRIKEIRSSSLRN